MRVQILRDDQKTRYKGTFECKSRVEKELLSKSVGGKLTLIIKICDWSVWKDFYDNSNIKNIFIQIKISSVNWGILVHGYNCIQKIFLPIFRNYFQRLHNF